MAKQQLSKREGCDNAHFIALIWRVFFFKYRYFMLCLLVQKCELTQLNTYKTHQD